MKCDYVGLTSIYFYLGIEHLVMADINYDNGTGSMGSARSPCGALRHKFSMDLLLSKANQLCKHNNLQLFSACCLEPFSLLDHICMLKRLRRAGSN